MKKLTPAQARLLTKLMAAPIASDRNTLANGSTWFWHDIGRLGSAIRIPHRHHGHNIRGTVTALARLGLIRFQEEGDYFWIALDETAIACRGA